MGDQPVAAVLGDSLLMEGVAMSLLRYPQLSLNHLDSSSVNTWQQVNTLSPAIVVLELELSQSPLVISLLKDKPGILLIGLDLECSRVIVLNSRHQAMHTIHDLYRLIGTKLEEELLSSLTTTKSSAALTS